MELLIRKKFQLAGWLKFEIVKRESNSRDNNIIKLWIVYPCRSNTKNLKLWGSIAMQDEPVGFWPFPIFF